MAAAQLALERDFTEKCPSSVRLSERGNRVLPGGVAHDNRHVGGPRLYVRSAKGALKSDLDGNSYVDYWVGHGSLLLGHCRREVVEAIHLAAMEVTHPGACHEREVLWAERVTQLIPGAEKVRFTASGSEATALALRLARAFTGKPKIIKLQGHFHGWLDHAVVGYELPFDLPFSRGVPDEIAAQTVAVPANLAAVEAALNAYPDAAGVILEPTGGAGGTTPLDAEFSQGLCKLTKQHGVLLIFDEVITGFRVAPGGAQARFGVEADLTCLAKILAGGLPGGAVCGPNRIMKLMEFGSDQKRNRRERVAQYGTFNANPISAAAGAETLRLIADGRAGAMAEARADELRQCLNDVFRRENVPWAAYGFSSVFHLLTAAEAEDACAVRDGQKSAAELSPTVLKAKGPVDGLLRRALQLEGVDLPPGRQAWLSAEHGKRELGLTLAAFSGAISRLRRLNCL
jgi:glutamate-1-semialdehyde 2,1-aminomutase